MPSETNNPTKNRINGRRVGVGAIEKEHVKEFSEYKHGTKPGELLSRLKALSWLSLIQLTGLASELNVVSFKRNQLVLNEVALSTGVNILLSGVAKLSCVNAASARVTVALLAPSLVPEFPEQFASRWRIQCAAYSDCKVGSVSWERFNAITVNAQRDAFRTFHQNNLKLWYRLLIRSSNYLGLGLRERLRITLLELCSDFGVEESRGTLLRVSFSHQDIAHLVGASRPRITEHLAQLERERLVIRQGRQLIVCVDKIGNGIGLPSSIESGSQKRLAAL
jgi:CRP-like cAMP-binding protein